MKKIYYIGLIIIAIVGYFLYSVINFIDHSSSNINDDNIDSLIFADDTLVNESPFIDSINIDKKDSVEIEVEKKAKIISKSILKKKIKDSPFKNKTCDEILKKYEKIIKEIVEDPSLLQTPKLKNIVTNIHHIHCMKVDSSYKKKVQKINLLLEKLDDEDDDE